MSHSGEELSDDEIFFGMITLKEVKKHIWNNHHGQRETYKICSSPQDHNTSLQIIEAHSQPNLRPGIVCSPKFSSVPGSPACENRKSDESFVQMEKIVDKLCMPPGKAENLELNNTLEVIEYILNNGPNMDAIKSNTQKNIETKKIHSSSSNISPKKDCTPIKISSPTKKIIEITGSKSPKYFTPVKNTEKQQADVFATPSSTIMKAKTPIFKTPANLHSQKKSSASSLKKTPNKISAYQHISSPIASYINNCPQVPLVKEIHPKKPLPAPSSIPKFVKNPLHIQNKENTNLPSIAYKSAKKTKVIHIPDEEKLPQSQWAKKIVSTLPRPTVMKHETKKNILSQKPVLNLQEDSFSNLSVHQAEVSVCTQKNAVKSKKH